jgi:ribosome-interacting GTPase 1
VSSILSLLLLLSHHHRLLGNTGRRRREKGPINYQAMVPQSVLTPELVHRICREYRIMSCDLIVREDATVDQLLDVIEVSCLPLSSVLTHD